MPVLRSVLPLRMVPGNTAGAVGVLARSVRALFGSPSFLRANGMRETGAMSRAGDALRRAARGSVPVFQIDRRGSMLGEGLPRLWLSEEMPDSREGGARKLAYSYPTGKDTGGKRALALAELYFAEGMSRFGDAVALACFQAAELLYLHACERGSVEAHTRLGVLYRFDMCRGAYWRDTLSAHAKHAADSVSEKAVRALRRAAARGSAEAKWRLGDMMREGIGCAVNEALAYSLYRGSFCRAAGATLDEVDAVRDAAEVLALVSGPRASLEHAGCAAARIARCKEMGTGCARDAQGAHAWYCAAAALLDSCVGAGSWFFTEELALAESGAERMAAAQVPALPEALAA